MQTMKVFAFVFLLLMAGQVDVALSEDSLRVISGKVIDRTQTLSESQKEHLSLEVLQVERQANLRLAVLVIESTGTESIEEFSLRIARGSDLATAEGRSVLLVLAKYDARVRIEVASGLQYQFSDKEAQDVIDKLIVPSMREGKVFEALYYALPAIGNASKGWRLKGALANSKSRERNLIGLVLIVCAFMFFWSSISYLSSRRSSKRGSRDFYYDDVDVTPSASFWSSSGFDFSGGDSGGFDGGGASGDW